MKKKARINFNEKNIIFFVSPYLTAPYFIAAKVKKTRYTLAGALLANFAGIGASWIITVLVFGR